MTTNSQTNITDRRLIVIGAGDLARELCGWFPQLRISGFLASHLSEPVCAGMPPIIGTSEDYVPQRDDIFVCAIGNPATRLAISREFEARGAEFATLIHESAAVPPSSSVGPGTIALPYAILDVNAHIGKHCLLYFRAGIGHDATAGDGCTVLTNAVVGARCVLGEGVIISTLAFTNPGISIGSFAQVGANSFAARDVPPHAVAVGVPARILSSHVEKTSAAA
jgi:sugar O-acyltransferase (sialic acid O-acetyltransferase NeuD family)